LGLLGEVEPFDIGVGTPMAFRCITLPKTVRVSKGMWQRLQTLLTSFGVRSFLYDHVNPKNNRATTGVRLEFDKVNELRSFELFIALLQFFKKEGIQLTFSAAFNKAVGTKNVQEVIAGTMSQHIFFKKVDKYLEKFRQRAKRFFLY
jgi:hypothetical protein